MVSISRKSVLFVYNSDSGLFNTLTDIAHKIFAPGTYSCAMCAITHGYFAVRPEWQEFLESLDADCRFMHRDEFAERYPGTAVALPAVFIDDQVGGITQCLDAETIQHCRTMSDIKVQLRAHCID
ncbi:MAG: hypothetical protein JSW10_00480 [Pseudomonadota bacterium]|nr:MAG: hypothetical protein JSW10_00480 [Pseudomonadota bacterium]